MTFVPGQPRKGYEEIDTFLAMASRHLGAVDAVLLPAVRRHAPEGQQLVHDYVHAEKELEIMLAHVKARAYGSSYEAGHSWPDVWADVDSTLDRHHAAEAALAIALTDVLDPAALDATTEALLRAESTAPTRPHPYAPHTGVAGQVSRRVMHAVDAFWDATEGRMIPEKEHRERGRPGRFTQYFLADPRFDEEEPPET
jgi:hypothetical protein